MILCLLFDGQATQVCDAEGPNNPPAFFRGSEAFAALGGDRRADHGSRG